MIFPALLARIRKHSSVPEWREEDQDWYWYSLSRLRKFREEHGILAKDERGCQFDPRIAAGGDDGGHDQFFFESTGHHLIETGENEFPVFYGGGSYSVIEAPSVFGYVASGRSEEARRALWQMAAQGDGWDKFCGRLIDFYEAEGVPA